MKQTLTLVATICAGLALTGFCSYPNHARITNGGKQLCAKHHIPLVTAHGFTYPEGQVVLLHYKPYKLFERIDRCTPNRIDDYQWIKRRDGMTKPTLVTYCPRCEAEFQEQWYGPIITPKDIVGTWRVPKTGYTVTYLSDGTMHAEHGSENYTGTWKIVFRGQILQLHKGDSFEYWHIVQKVAPNYLMVRGQEDPVKYIRVR
jgi:hypothetical protein